MFDFYSLFEYSQLKAINSALDPTIDWFWRMKCREYSKEFHTPLHVVMRDLDPLFVLQHLYESQYNRHAIEEDLDGVLENLYKMKDPNYTPISKEELEELVDSVMNKEIKRLSKKKSPTQETIQTEIKAAEVKDIKKTLLAKKGSMSFEDMEGMDSSVESGKANFED